MQGLWVSFCIAAIFCPVLDRNKIGLLFIISSFAVNGTFLCVLWTQSVLPSERVQQISLNNCPCNKPPTSSEFKTMTADIVLINYMWKDSCTSVHLYISFTSVHKPMISLNSNFISSCTKHSQEHNGKNYQHWNSLATWHTWLQMSAGSAYANCPIG